MNNQISHLAPGSSIAELLPSTGAVPQPCGPCAVPLPAALLPAVPPRPRPGRPRARRSLSSYRIGLCRWVPLTAANCCCCSMCSLPPTAPSRSPGPIPQCRPILWCRVLRGAGPAGLASGWRCSAWVRVPLVGAAERRAVTCAKREASCVSSESLADSLIFPRTSICLSNTTIRCLTEQFAE